MYVLDEKESCDKNDPTYIIGTLRIIPPGIKFNRIGIGRVVVNKNARGNGLANKMMTKAIQYIEKKYGLGEIELSAQLAIKDLYIKSGFKVISDVYLEDGIDHVRMVRPSS
jgi:ElaA protein